jgi:molybdopterin-guanine dinucleotide biosynthesis protein A
MHEDAVAIVLAGGASRRLAEAGLGPGGKAALVVAGETLVGRVCRTVAAEVPRVIVVAAPGQPLPDLPSGVEIVRDRTPLAGPLAGLRDGLRHVLRAGGAVPRVAFVTSCDVPLLRRSVVRLLVALAHGPAVRAVVPMVGGHPQVLVSAVAVDIVDTIESLLAAGDGSLRGLFAALAARAPESVLFVPADALAEADPGLESFLDIDDPGDLARFRARKIPPSRG